MSRYDYLQSIGISKMDPSFAALIMAAMRKADDYNVMQLRKAFPDIWAELWTRYHSPGGYIDGEKSEDL